MLVIKELRDFLFVLTYRDRGGANRVTAYS